jgi:hypothetical protein
MKKQMTFLSILMAAALVPTFAMAESPASPSLVQQSSQAGDGSSDEMPLNDPQADYPGSPEKPLTRGLLNKLKELNQSEKILEAWTLLAAQKDGYAKSATRIFGDSITVEKCVVEGNWKMVVGDEARAVLYLPYAKLYQRYYIEFLETNLRYPNTLDIEKMYQQADIDFGLPQSVSVDLMMNLVPTDWTRRKIFDEISSLAHVGRKAHPKLWYHYTDISDARISPDSITAEDLNVDEAKALYRRANKKVAKCMIKKLKL